MTMFGASWGLRLADVTPVAKLVGIRLGDGCSQDASGHGSLVDLAEWCCCEPQDVLDALDVLQASADVRWHRAGHDEIVYVLPPGAQPPPREFRVSGGPELARLTLYVIRGRVGVKVGITANLEQRVTGLRLVMFDDELRSEWSIEGRESVIRKAERRAHILLADVLIRNEWFSTSVEDAVEAAQAAFDECNRVTG